MKCNCGSTKFTPLGRQEVPPQWDGKMWIYTKLIYLTNCCNCGTTKSCSKRFYNWLKFKGINKQPEGRS